MAFNGCYFTFDGKSCHDFGMMIYDFSSYSQDEAIAFASTGNAVEDRIANRYSSLFYGIKQDQSLTFRLVFGADDYYLDNDDPFSRYQVAKIAEWLTGHDEMKWLTIDQVDMARIRYKCRVSELRLITTGGSPWAFQCTVTCDSPFAYLEEETRTYTVNSSSTIDIDNISSYKGYYRPKIKIITRQAGDVSITNTSDNNRLFKFTSLANNKTITVDNENQIITSDTNLYPSFNFNFLRLVPGNNRLTLSGNFTLEVTLAFPVDVGA